MRLHPTHLSSSVSYRLRRSFHSNLIRHEQSHYETLKIPVNATQSEVKKAFYTLSKKCHPDCNPSDPQASKRFITLSTAYSVLSTPSKRSSYDSTLLKGTQVETIPRGTYSSTNPVGGRSPTGLSRRRAQFRGPPPSFYRNGGWGPYTEKRQNSHQESTNPAKSKTDPSTDQSFAYGSGEFGPGRNHYEYVVNDSMYHFDREQHLRTHENHQRRQTKGKGERKRVDEELPKGLFESFVTVAGILTVGIILPLSFLRVF